MIRAGLHRESPNITLLTGISAAVLVVCIVLFPEQAFSASLQGLTVWWKIVFPALLPFMVASELMLAYGLAQGLGAWLDPLMRFLFKIPGIGGTALVMGLAAGSPAGAEMTVKLRKQQQLSQSEAEKLLALSHVSSPVFIVLVVVTGFMQKPQYGLFLAVVYYISAIVMGCLMRNVSSVSKADTLPGEASDASPAAPAKSKAAALSFRSAGAAMCDAHRLDGRTFGKVLGDAVGAGAQKLFMIGGLMMMFAVLIRVLQILLTPLHIPDAWLQPLLSGLLEVHIGSYSLSQASAEPLVWQMAAIAAILAWSGISSHAQVQNLIQGTDLRYSTFLRARLVHTLIAAILAVLCWKPFISFIQPKLTGFLTSKLASWSMPTGFALDDFAVTAFAEPVDIWQWSGWKLFYPMAQSLLWIVLILTGLSLCIAFVQKITRLFR